MTFSNHGKDRYKVSGDMSIVRQRPAVIALDDGRVLAIGGGGQDNFVQRGTNTAEVFDFISWSPIAPMVQPRTEFAALLLRHGIHAGKVLVLGGTNADLSGFENFLPVNFLASGELYDPATNTWAPIADAPDGFIAPNFVGSAVELNDGRVVVAGGAHQFIDGAHTTPTPAGPFPASGVPASLQTVIWNPATNTWTQAADLNFARIQNSMTVTDDNRVLVCGGNSVFTFSPPYLDTAEIYNPVANTWTSAVMPAITDGVGGKEKASRDGDPDVTTVNSAQRIFPGAAVLPDGRILIFGGQGPKTGDITSPISRRGCLFFNQSGAFTAASFTPAPNMPVAKAPFGLYGTLRSGFILATGGLDDLQGGFDLVPAPTTEVYNPYRKVWEIGADVPDVSGMSFISMGIPTADGRFVAVGGPGPTFFPMSKQSTIYETGLPAQLLNSTP